MPKITKLHSQPMPVEYQLKHKTMPHIISVDTGLVHNVQMTHSVLYG